MYLISLTSEDLEFLRFNRNIIDNCIYDLDANSSEWDIQCAANMAKDGIERDRYSNIISDIYLDNKGIVVLEVLASYIYQKLREEI